MALCSPARNENGVYVAFGHSMVTNPWGDVLAALDEKAGIVYADVDTKKIEEVRAGLPLLKHRRPALYEID
jgi:predicted amidohydrolase